MKLLKTCLLVISFAVLKEAIAGEYQGKKLASHHSFSSAGSGPYEGVKNTDETKAITLEQAQQSDIQEVATGLAEPSRPCAAALESFFRLIQNEDNARTAKIRTLNGFRDRTICQLNHSSAILLQKLIDEKTLSENDPRYCNALKIICQRYLALTSEIEQILDNPTRICMFKYSQNQRAAIQDHLLKIWRLVNRDARAFELNY